jgi:hypothetical protein
LKWKGPALLEAAAGPVTFVSGAYNMPEIIAHRDKAQASRQKYFKGRVYAGEQVSHFVVWDGRSGYKSHPPPNLLLAEKLTGRVCIAQIRNRTVGAETVTALLEDCDSVVLWTRNTTVYRAIVENIKRQADGWLS